MLRLVVFSGVAHLAVLPDAAPVLEDLAGVVHAACAGRSVATPLWEVEVQAPAMEGSHPLLPLGRECLLWEEPLDSVLHLLVQRGLAIGVEVVRLLLRRVNGKTCIALSFQQNRTFLWLLSP